MTPERMAEIRERGEAVANEPNCPECGVGVARPKCFFEFTDCPRHELANPYRANVRALERHAMADISGLLAECTRLAAENAELKAARQNIIGDDLCWIDNVDQIKALPEAEFLESCRRYRNQLASEVGEASGCRTIAQLEIHITKVEAENTELRQDKERLEWMMGNRNSRAHIDAAMQATAQGGEKP